MDDLFRLSLDPLELIVRGTAIYWFLFILFRLILRRDVGSIAIADVLLLVLIADAAQSAMEGGYTSITEGMILVATLAFWNVTLDWLCYRSPRLRKIVEPQPLLLVRDGKVCRKNMRRELITMDELQSKLREHGLQDVAQVHLSYLEGDGEITVVARDAMAKPKRSVPEASD